MLILTTIRGFCLLISKNTYCRNIGKRIRSHTLSHLIPIARVSNLDIIQAKTNEQLLLPANLLDEKPSDSAKYGLILM